MSAPSQVDRFDLLARLLGPGQLVTRATDLITYEIDAGLDRGRPDAVAIPRTAQDVERIARWAAQQRVPLVARGAGTGLSGGAVADRGGLVVAFAQMDRVLEVDHIGRSVVVQPGVVNLALDGLVGAHGLYFPPDPSSQRASTIGGNIAENSGGPHCFKYGVTTNYVTGLEVVLAGGRKVRLGGRALDYPEYDFVGLLTGSEGTLGIVVEASLRLVRRPPAVRTLMVAFESVESAGEAVSALIARGLAPATLEMMDQKIMRIIEDYAHAGLPTEAGAALIVEVDGYPASVAPQIEEIATILGEHEARDLRVAATAEQRDAIWYGRKSAAGAMSRLAPAYYLVDVTVPRSKLAVALSRINRICEDAGLRVGYVFHAGDGNLHPLILIDDPSDPQLVSRVLAAGRKTVELCVEYDGSITGEHGVGIEKRDLMPLMYSPAELDAMRDVKQVFDPDELLNPGKILPPRPDHRPTITDHRPPTKEDRRLKIEDNHEDAGEMLSSIFNPRSSNSSSLVVRPSSAAEAAEVIREHTSAGRSIRIRGGGTRSLGLPGADVLLSTAGMRGIRAYARDDLYVTVGAGTPVAELQAELAREGMWAPLVAPWPESTVGGVVATNWNAPLRMRYGGLRDQVLASTVALGDGRVIRAGRPVVKNVAGYDLPKLFVGAHGTLGLIADVTLKLAPLPRARASLIVPLDDLERALACGARLLHVCLNASALLLVRPTTDDQRPTTADTSGPFSFVVGRSSFAGAWPMVLVYTAEGLPEDVAAELAEARAAMQSAGVSEVIEQDEPSGSQIWASWLGATRPEADATVVRAGVAARDLPALLRSLPDDPTGSFVADLAAGLLYVRGQGDVWPLRRAAQAMGGYTVSLQALGTRDGWGHVPGSLDLMRALRQRWGAGGLLNPGAFLV
jgi:D-lactate dehydrogenase (cytochrome)